MKIAAVPKIICSALIALLLIIPLPAPAVKILFWAESLFSMAILLSGATVIVRKTAPKALPHLLLYFSLFALALNIGAARNIFLFVLNRLEEVPLTTKLASELFEKDLVPGILLTVVLILLSIFGTLIPRKKISSTLGESVKILRSSIIAQAILYAVYTVAAVLIAHRTQNTEFSEAFAAYIPITSAHTIMFFIPLCLAGVGVALLNWLEKKEKERLKENFKEQNLPTEKFTFEASKLQHWYLAKEEITLKDIEKSEITAQIKKDVDNEQIILKTYWNMLANIQRRVIFKDETGTNAQSAQNNSNEPNHLTENLNDISALVKKYGKSIFSKGDYYFDFLNNIFKYKGENIWLSDGNRLMLAKWLIADKKDNNTRVHIYHMRQKFGEDFLADVDRHGNLR